MAKLHQWLPGICLLICIFAPQSTLSSSSVLRFFRGRARGGMLGAPHNPGNKDLPPEQWLTQRLDHFDLSNPTTWQQRYFVNNTFYKPGGPVFLMIGGEGKANPIWMVEGQWIKYAQTYNALCVYLEHRYYGKSHPQKDMSVPSLRWLNSEQALADLAYFHSYITDTFKVAGAKWVSFGGSYPGSLSAWFRLKYPHLVHAAISTSAPVQAVLDFKEYLAVVRDSLATTGASCNVAVQNATTTVEKLMQTSTGRALLKSMFRLCDDIDITNVKDVANLYQALAGNFEGVVQYNKDNRKFEGAVDTGVTIDTLCNIMTNQSLNLHSPLERYAAVSNLILKTYSEKCLDFKYDSMIKELQQTDWSSSASEGGRQWTFQTCTEFGFFQSSNLVNQPFGHGFSAKYFVQQCTDIFGPQFSPELLTRGINSTNNHYGGFGLKVTRVYFINGSIDPWHALGILYDLSPSAPAIFIKGTAHCANMYPDSPDDLPALRDARVQIEKTIGQWLSEDS